MLLPKAVHWVGILNLGEIKKVREMSSIDNLKRCGTAFAVASTYIPVLCDMAEEYLKSRALNRIHIRYSIDGDSIGGWIIKGSDGFSIIMGKGDSIRLICNKIVERLNGV